MGSATITTDRFGKSPLRFSWLPALALLLVLRLIAPGGYIGGGGDDYYYLDAARCIARDGWCLPTTHWATRWPLVLPMAAVLRLFGDSFVTVALVPLLYTVGAVALFASNVERRFGVRAARWATLALVATPIVSMPALQPMVDTPELCWLLGALLALQVAVARNFMRFAMLAGVCAALAVMTRMSALAIVPVVGLAWLILGLRRWRLVFAAAGAFAAMLAIEAAVYGIMTGNPLFGWMLSLHHARIPSSELPAGIDLTRSALFNLDLIRNWRRSMGIEVHWTIDPILNLLADPRSGLTLVAAAVLAFVYRPLWRVDAPVSRAIRVLAGAAAIHFLLLVFALAIDPKPRMFLPELAVAATVIGVVATRAWAAGQRPLSIAVALLLGIRAVVTSVDAVTPRAAEPVAAQWIAAARPTPGTDDWTRRSLALVPAARSLPAESGDRPLLTLTERDCAAIQPADRQLVRGVRFDRDEPSPIAWLRSRGILFGARGVPSLCLYGAKR